MHAILVVVTIVAQRLVVEDAARYVALELALVIAPRCIDFRDLIDRVQILGFSATWVNQRLNGLFAGTIPLQHVALFHFRTINIGITMVVIKGGVLVWVLMQKGLGQVVPLKIVNALVHISPISQSVPILLRWQILETVVVPEVFLANLRRVLDHEVSCTPIIEIHAIFQRIRLTGLSIIDSRVVGEVDVLAQILIILILQEGFPWTDTVDFYAGA